MTGSPALDVLHRLSNAIVGVSELKQVYELILDEVISVLHVEKASILLYDDTIRALRVVAARGMSKGVMDGAIIRVGEGISGKVFLSHKPLLIDDIRAQDLGPSRGSYKTFSLMSMPVTCFPMKVGEEALGVINVTDRIDGNPFTEEDLKLLATLTNQVAAYLHICRLSEKLHVGERLREQLEIARQIQYRLVPTIPRELNGIDACGQLVTAERVGGDYYDCFLHSPHHMSFTVADVSGHSIGAAMIMASFRAALRSQEGIDLTPAHLVSRMNEILYDDLYQAEQFISMAYVDYHTTRKFITVTTAGHPPLLLWRRSERKFENLHTDDPLMGLEKNVPFHERKYAVAAGDVIVLYTDGFTEAANERGERFGEMRLRRVIEEKVNEKTQTILDHLLTEVTNFASPRPLQDDVTAVVLKIL